MKAVKKILNFYDDNGISKHLYLILLFLSFFASFLIALIQHSGRSDQEVIVILPFVLAPFIFVLLGIRLSEREEFSSMFLYGIIANIPSLLSSFLGFLIGNIIF